MDLEFWIVGFGVWEFGNCRISEFGIWNWEVESTGGAQSEVGPSPRPWPMAGLCVLGIFNENIQEIRGQSMVWGPDHGMSTLADRPLGSGLTVVFYPNNNGVSC